MQPTIAASLASARSLAHEGLVDLQPVERKFLQVGQAGIAGAEIVECDVDAQPLNPPERLQRAFVVLQQDVFGDFEFEQPRRKARVASAPPAIVAARSPD